jgi:hypothetical protein
VSAFTAAHVERSHAFVLDLPMERAFRLFEPEGERLWAQGWDPEYLHPAGVAAARPGVVFRTRHGGEETVWMVLRHDPAAGLVEYMRATPGSRMGTVLVQCSPLAASRTRVSVQYALTALSEAGNTVLEGLDEAHYRAFIESWRASIVRRDAGGGG